MQVDPCQPRFEDQHAALDRPGERNGVDRAGRLAGKAAQFGRDLADPVGQPLDCRHIFGRRFTIAALDQQPAIGGIAADRGDGLGGFMRDAGGDLAQRRQAIGLAQSFAQRVGACLAGGTLLHLAAKFAGTVRHHRLQFAGAGGGRGGPFGATMAALTQYPDAAGEQQQQQQGRQPHRAHEALHAM